jgi:hypothetical protein
LAVWIHGEIWFFWLWLRFWVGSKIGWATIRDTTRFGFFFGLFRGLVWFFFWFGILDELVLFLFHGFSRLALAFLHYSMMIWHNNARIGIVYAEIITLGIIIPVWLISSP